MGKLVLIDGNAIMHRAYHALPKSLTTKDKEPINAVYGFVSMLLRIVDDLEPTHIGVAFDRKEPTFRHKKYEKYQAHRPPTDEELSSQFEKVKRTLESFDIQVFERAGYEADDVIGTLAKRAAKRKAKDIDEVVIVTGDKDILQLVNDKVRVYLPKRGLSDVQLMGEREVAAKLGIEPRQVVDYKALVGDPSDNYPGVYGVGPKTAERLLNKYDTFDNIYKHLDDLSENSSKKLKEGKKEGNLSYELAKIATDVPLKVNFDKLSDWEIGSKKTIDLFDEFGFKTLKKRVKAVGKEIERKNQGVLF